jgi:hypothetical protein
MQTGYYNGQLKGKLSLCLIITRHAMKTYRGVEVQLHHSLPRQLEESGQLYAQAALPPGKELPVRTG